VRGFVYAGQLEPVAELDGTGNVVATFLYAERGHVPSLMRKGGATYRIVADHLGSVRLVIDVASGQIAQRLDYDAFGAVTQDTNAGFQPFGFASGVFDRDTGLDRFGARDYDPAAGRWTAKDPIRFGGAQANVFAYAGSDPINALDATGLARWDKLFGLPKPFWRWLHRSDHMKGRPDDFTKDEATELHREWERLADRHARNKT
jgi:RHS repeat-associated protein